MKADVQGDMAICPNCGHEGKLSSYIDGCDACGAKFLVSDFETKVSGFSLEEDAQRQSISNYIKAGVTVGITAAALAVLAICAGGIMFLLLALGRNGFHADCNGDAQEAESAGGNQSKDSDPGFFHR